MSDTPTPKQAKFAEVWVETGNGAEAYRQAYSANGMSDNAIWREASVLLKHPKVAQRVQELQAKHQEAHAVTVDSLTTMARKAYSKAESDEKGAPAMVQAATFMAKLHGLIVDKQQVTSKNEKADLSDAELAAIATAGGTRATEETDSEERPSSLH